MLLYSLRQSLNLNTDDEAGDDSGQTDEDERQDNLEEESARVSLLDDPSLEQECFELAHSVTGSEMWNMSHWAKTKG